MDTRLPKGTKQNLVCLPASVFAIAASIGLSTALFMMPAVGAHADTTEPNNSLTQDHQVQDSTSSPAAPQPPPAKKTTFMPIPQPTAPGGPVLPPEAPQPGERQASLALSAMSQGSRVQVTGVLSSGGQAIMAAMIEMRVDDRRSITSMTGMDGRFETSFDGSRFNDGMPHTIVAMFDGQYRFTPAQAQATFVIGQPGAVMLDVSASSGALGGGGVLLTGSLRYVNNAPASGLRVFAGVGDASGQDASALVDENGSFQMGVQVPAVTQETDIRITVHFDGDRSIPAVNKVVMTKVKPKPPETPTPTQTAPAKSAQAMQPAPEKNDLNKVAFNVPLPSLVSLWPLWLTVLLSMGSFVGLGMLVLRKPELLTPEDDEAVFY